MQNEFETSEQYQARLARIATRDGTTIEQAEYMLLIVELARYAGKKRNAVAFAHGYKLDANGNYVKI